MFGIVLKTRYLKQNYFSYNFSDYPIIIECKILSKDFNDLIKIKSNIEDLSQVKYLNTKKIHINNNIIEFYYYGNLNILIESLSLLNIFFNENNDCIITTK